MTCSPMPTKHVVRHTRLIFGRQAPQKFLMGFARALPILHIALDGSRTYCPKTKVIFSSEMAGGVACGPLCNPALPRRPASAEPLSKPKGSPARMTSPQRAAFSAHVVPASSPSGWGQRLVGGGGSTVPIVNTARSLRLEWSTRSEATSMIRHPIESNFYVNVSEADVEVTFAPTRSR